MAFQPKTLDFELSPFTGLTRQSWIEAGEYLLEGIFQNIRHFEDPVVMPRKETEVTYPHSADAVWEQRAEYFEGLARSFFLAAPLIHDNPDLTLCGYRIRDYYKTHVLRICSETDAFAAGRYEQMQEISGDSHRSFQQTVETCALVICLWMCREEIWADYTQAEKDSIAEFLTGYAHGNTVPQNWRLFNMLDMAFLHMEGYPIDEDIMAEHTQAVLNYYAGDGWYRDGHCFDYYSCWAFNVYAPLWNLWYGYEHMPEAAARFEAYSNRLMETYPDFFDRDGFTNMWGRSNIYRNAATSAFDGNFFLKSPTADPGLARRICSGSLLQFFTREDFLYKGVPTLGFYGQFMPLVQSYSCAESPLWLGKAFLCLHLPKEHPFWSAKEHNGTWDTLAAQETKVTVLDAPALCFSNHQANGSTILRTGKVVKAPEDLHGMWNYSKLCFHTKYPWEAGPVGHAEAAGDTMTKTADDAAKTSEAASGTPASAVVESQQYVLRDFVTGSVQRGNVTLWHGEKEQVLYRRQFFNYRMDTECHWMYALNLADFTVPYGILRVDQLRLFRQSIELILGSYGFPDNGTEIMTLREDAATAIVLRGHDFTGKPKQLAMTIYDGWDALDLIHSTGTNPDSEKSIVLYARTARTKHYGNEPHLLISQVITKESLEDFMWDEIFPIRSVTYTDKKGKGGYGKTVLTLKDGTVRKIDFTGLEGKLML